MEEQLTKRWSDKTLNRIVTGFSIVLILFIFSWVYNFMNPTPKTIYVDSDYSKRSATDAYTMMRVFIKDGLKAPSTAEFASMNESVISKISNDTWKIKSHVDSQNIFGAMLRTKFTITIRYLPSSNEWEKISLVTN